MNTSEDEKRSLIELISKYRFPFANKTIKEKWIIVYKKMKKDDILPDTITTISSLRKTYSRYTKTDNDYKIYTFLKPMINSVKITDQTKFFLYWIKLTESGKHELMNWLGESVMLQGVPVVDVCTILSDEFEKHGFLSRTVVTKYSKKEFKNFDMVKRRIGKIKSNTAFRTSIGRRQTAI